MAKKIKIVFLCGSLEPGCDGVGDYTRRLAAELRRQGHQAAAVALYDKHLADSFDGTQEVDGVILPVLRIAANCSTKKRFTWAKKYIERNNPDWISLQFVPYSFHPKGLPLLLSIKLKRLIQGFDFHIMFHELWVGINSEERLKIRLLGAVQKVLIKEFLNRLKPDCITTTIPIYKKHLSDPCVKILPLFGNIPVISNKENLIDDSKNLKVVHFGSFTALTGEFELQLQFLNNAAKFYSKGIKFIVFGKGGPFKSKALEIAKNTFGEDRVTDLGHLSAQEISILLQTADIGVSRANFILSGKSGSTLAMLEHGLLVLLRGKKSNCDTDDIWNRAFHEQLLFCDSDYSKVIEKKPAKSKLIEIADMFVKILN